MGLSEGEGERLSNSVEECRLVDKQPKLLDSAPKFLDSRPKLVDS
jgi:hypothetical protein